MEDRFEKFTLLIYNIYRAISKIKSNEMEKLGLKSTHVSCLYYLFKNGGKLTPKQLCSACEEDKASISRAVDYLEKCGLLTFNPTDDKRYKVPIVLTEKGQKTGKFVSDKVDEILSKASEGLSENDRKCLYKCLALISDNLKKILNENGEK